MSYDTCFKKFVKHPVLWVRNTAKQKSRSKNGLDYFLQVSRSDISGLDEKICRFPKQ